VFELIVLLEQFFFSSPRKPLDPGFDPERKAPAPDRLLEYEL